jgi:hypothetical protein
MREVDLRILVSKEIHEVNPIRYEMKNDSAWSWPGQPDRDAEWEHALFEQTRNEFVEQDLHTVLYGL